MLQLLKNKTSSLILISISFAVVGCAQKAPVRQQSLSVEFETELIKELNKIKRAKGMPTRQIITTSDEYNPFDRQVKKLGY